MTIQDKDKNITRLPFLDGQVTLTPANTNTVATRLDIIEKLIEKEQVTQKGYRFVVLLLLVAILIIGSL